MSELRLRPETLTYFGLLRARSPALYWSAETISQWLTALSSGLLANTCLLRAVSIDRPPCGQNLLLASTCGHKRKPEKHVCYSRGHELHQIFFMSIGWGFFFADLLLRNYAIIRSRHNIQEGGKGVITICWNQYIIRISMRHNKTSSNTNSIPHINCILWLLLRQGAKPMFLLCCPQPIHDMVQEERISVGRRICRPLEW